jgi:hypothetical protein
MLLFRQLRRTGEEILFAVDIEINLSSAKWLGYPSFDEYETGLKLYQEQVNNCCYQLSPMVGSAADRMNLAAGWHSLVVQQRVISELGVSNVSESRVEEVAFRRCTDHEEIRYVTPKYLQSW